MQTIKTALRDIQERKKKTFELFGSGNYSEFRYGQKSWDDLLSCHNYF